MNGEACEMKREGNFSACFLNLKHLSSFIIITNNSRPLRGYLKQGKRHLSKRHDKAANKLSHLKEQKRTATQ
jgi:hypothetical protein